MALLFNWQFENSTTVDYSAGDTTGTSYGSTSFDSSIKQSGSYSLKLSAGYSYYYFTLTSSDIIKQTGSMSLYVYFASAPTNGTIITTTTIDSSNLLRLYVGSGNKLTLWYKGGANTVYCSSEVVLSGAQWYLVKCRWRNGATTPTMSIQIGSNTADTDSTVLSAWTASTGTFEIGNSDSNAEVMYIDNFKIYDTWDGIDGTGSNQYSPNPGDDYMWE